MCLWAETIKRFSELPRNEQEAILARIREAERLKHANIAGYIQGDDDRSNNPNSSHRPD